MEVNNIELTLEHKHSKFILFDKDRLYHLLKDSNNLQEVLEKLDSAVVPVSRFNDGLISKEDKAYIEYMKVMASDKIYVYDILQTGELDPVTKIRIDSNTGLKVNKIGDEVTIGVEEHLKKVLTSNGEVNINNDSTLSLLSDGLIDIEPSDAQQSINISTKRLEDFITEQALVWG